MRSRRVVLVGSVLALSAVAAGCGGGSDSSSSTTGASGASGATGASGGAALSQDEFTSQANAICKDANDKVAALPNPTSLDETASTIEQEIPIVTDAQGQLEALTPPSDLQDKYSQYLDDTRSQVDLAGQLKDAAASGDTAKVQQLAQQLQANNTDAEAKSLGLTECAKNVGPQG